LKKKTALVSSFYFLVRFLSILIFALRVDLRF
jgi:hypothetical protein